MDRRSKGEGSIKARKDGRFEARVIITDPITLKNKRISFYGKTASEVSDKIFKSRQDGVVGKVIDGDKTRFYDWACVVYDEFKKPKLSASSREVYITILEKHIKCSSIDVQLKDLDLVKLQRYFNNFAKTYSKESIKRTKGFISFCIKKAISSRLIIFNPMEGVETPVGNTSNERGFQYLSVSEQREVMKYLSDLSENLRLKAAISLIICTGIRNGEALGITWPCLDLQSKTMIIKEKIKREKINSGKTATALISSAPKTKSSIRTLPIPDFVIPALKAWRIKQNENRLIAGSAYKDSDLVFTTDFGLPVDPRNFTRAWHRALIDNKLRDVNVHALRHTYATRMLELDENPKTVSEMLGHGSIKTTLDKYSHISEETKRSAADKFNKAFG